MNYIIPIRKYKYFVATESGEMPTAHKYEYEASVKDLSFCVKGWPEKTWSIYRIVFEKDPETKEYKFKQIDKQVEKYWQQWIIPDLLTESLNEKYSYKAIKAS